ncbi:MAG: VWA domain-containing protein [Defluviitaleaceae bacterium]|nr:VWA domain-containing protein [Defluviitaleaceae bacterium]
MRVLRPTRSKFFKRILGIFLSLTLFISFPAALVSAVAFPLDGEGRFFDVYNMIADPDTSAPPTSLSDTDISDALIWTDKTVSADGGQPDEFLVTLSALSQSFRVNSYVEPSDTVFIIDVSGSMTEIVPGYGRSRIAMLVDALNEAIGILQTLITGLPLWHMAAAAAELPGL